MYIMGYISNMMYNGPLGRILSLMSQETREFIERLTLWLSIVGQHEILKTLPAYVTICKTPESLAKAILKRKKRQST